MTCLERVQTASALAPSAPLRTPEASFSDPDAFSFPAASRSLGMGCYLEDVRCLTIQAGRMTRQDSTAGGLRGAGTQGNTKGPGLVPFALPGCVAPKARLGGAGRGSIKLCIQIEVPTASLIPARGRPDSRSLLSPWEEGWQPLHPSAPCTEHGQVGGAFKKHPAMEQIESTQLLERAFSSSTRRPQHGPSLSSLQGPTHPLS